MILPTQVIKAEHKNPTVLVLASHVGTGKTTAVACLPNCLVIDFEGGSKTMDAMRVDIQQIAATENKHPGAVLKEVWQAIKEANKEKGSFVYDYIVYDGLTAIEQLVITKATNAFKKSVVGKGMLEKGGSINDVTTDVPKAGWQWFFNAFKEMYNDSKGLVKNCTIFLAHSKQGSLTKKGQEIAVRDINLTGKAKLELLRDASDCGYMYRADENTVMVNFKAEEGDVTIKGRTRHLSNQEFVLSSLDPKTHVLTVNWDKIFPGWINEPIKVQL